MSELFDQHVLGRVEINLNPFASTPIVLGITTREKGVSQPPYAFFNMGFHVGDDSQAVLTNRSLLAKDLKIPLESFVAAEQIHSNQIERVTSEDRGKGADSLETVIPGADGLYTTEKGMLLIACYADCVPVYFVARHHAAVGIAHAGWRGTVTEIVGRMIERWYEDLSIPPEDIEVMIGPSIGPCCYEVDDRVKDEVEKIDGISTEELLTPSTTKGHYFLNLQLTNRLILEKYGVQPENIQVSKMCTSCQTDLFYSHRKEEGKTGRMLGYIGLTGGHKL